MEIKQLDSELDKILNQLKINIKNNEDIIKDTKQLGKEYKKYSTKVKTVLDNAENNVNNIKVLKDDAENIFNELNSKKKEVCTLLEECNSISKTAIKENNKFFDKVTELNRKVDVEKENIDKDRSFIENEKKYMKKNMSSIMELKDNTENIFNEINLNKKNVHILLEECSLITKTTVKENNKVIYRLTELNEKIDREKENLDKELSFIETQKKHVEINLASISSIRDNAENIFNEVNLNKKNVDALLEQCSLITETTVKENNKFIDRVTELSRKIDTERENIDKDRSFIENEKIYIENTLEQLKNTLVSLTNELTMKRDNQIKLIEEYEQTKLTLEDKRKEITKVIELSNEKIESISKIYKTEIKDLNKIKIYLKISLALGAVSIISNIILFLRG